MVIHWLVVWLSGNALVSINVVTCTLPGPISAWVGKPSRYVTSHPGQLSLPIPLSVGTMSTGTSLDWECNVGLASHWPCVTDNRGLVV